jgi:hypothetical protein
MPERIKILKHHVDNCLAPFLRGASGSRVERIVITKIIPCIECTEFDDIQIYDFLKDPEKKAKFTWAVLEAARAYTNDTLEIIDDWQDKGQANFDLICRACGNYIQNKCSLDERFTSD